jgi:hypothetical protein
LQTFLLVLGGIFYCFLRRFSTSKPLTPLFLYLVLGLSLKFTYSSTLAHSYLEFTCLSLDVSYLLTNSLNYIHPLLLYSSFAGGFAVYLSLHSRTDPLTTYRRVHSVLLLSLFSIFLGS